MVPMEQPDVWSRATDQNILQALALLAGLPSRHTDEPELEQEAYFIALEGVTKWGLGEAVKATLRRKLGHAFLPSPPELRGLCDEAMRPHYAALERRRLERSLMEERAADRPALTEAQKARQVERMRQFHAHFAQQDVANDQAEFEARCLANGMTPEALVKVPDAKPAMRQMMDRS
ncbi:MAG: hypothetical protein DI629_12235 [Mesorhizobium amorphae]|nr:MAG: hypothetical protein DI629_12235 [Mesorhizobium amorphae]